MLQSFSLCGAQVVRCLYEYVECCHWCLCCGVVYPFSGGLGSLVPCTTVRGYPTCFVLLVFGCSSVLKWVFSGES